MVASGYGSHTAWHGCILMVWLNNSQDSTGSPCDVRTGIVRAPYGNLQCFSYPTGPVRDPQGCRTAPLRARKGIDTAIIGKNSARASYLAVRGPGCLWYLNPYGARKLIMHALKLYGPRTERQNSYGAARGPREWTYDFCSNSPGTARTGPGSVMWLRQTCIHMHATMCSLNH